MTIVQVNPVGGRSRVRQRTHVCRCYKPERVESFSRSDETLLPLLKRNELSYPPMLVRQSEQICILSLTECLTLGVDCYSE